MYSNFILSTTENFESMDRVSSSDYNTVSHGLNREGLDASGIDKWYASKGVDSMPKGISCKWHIPNEAERNFAEELVDLNLRSSLHDLRNLCRDDVQSDTSGTLKTLVFIDYSKHRFSSQIVRSALQDFKSGLSFTLFWKDAVRVYDLVNEDGC